MILSLRNGWYFAIKGLLANERATIKQLNLGVLLQRTLQSIRRLKPFVRLQMITDHLPNVIR